MYAQQKIKPIAVRGEYRYDLRRITWREFTAIMLMETVLEIIRTFCLSIGAVFLSALRVACPRARNTQLSKIDILEQRLYGPPEGGLYAFLLEHANVCMCF